MNNGGEASRVLISSSERKIIQDIREIAGNHGDEEIYAMLLECNMDPNEAAQKLFFQDTFHEVKRKRDRRKETAITKEQHDNHWRPGLQGRGNRGGRGGYYPRYQSSHGPSGANPGKGDLNNRAIEKGVHVTPSENASLSEAQMSSPKIMVNDLLKGELLGSSGDVAPQIPSAEISTSSEHQTVEENANHNAINNSGLISVQTPQFPDVPLSVIPVFDSHAPKETKEYELGNKVPEAQPVGSCLPIESAKISMSAQRKEQKYIFSSINKPLSASGGRSQQVIGHQKVAPNMEWKPKPTNQVPASVLTANETLGNSRTVVETDLEPVVPDSSSNSQQSTSKLQPKLEDLNLSERQHVIIPDHLQVPESQKSGLSFGSFDASIGVETKSTLVNGFSNERNSALLSESFPGSSHDDRSTLSEHSESSPQENPDHPPKQTENLPLKELDAPSNDPVMLEQEELRQEAVLSLEGSQISRMHTPPLYSAFGLVPPVLGGQFAPFEGSETQSRESSTIAGFVQPFDPSTNYYTQIYQPGADGDGRLSPYLAPTVNNYSRNNTAMPPYNSQLVPEGVVSSSMLPSASNGSTTQASTGPTLSSAVTGQQPLPSYRQPGAVHMPQYPPNYMPYGHYYSPFYVPTPIHPFFSGTHFAQQPLPSGLYPSPPAAVTASPVTAVTAATVKYSKSGTGSSNSSLSTPSTGGTYSSDQPRHSSSSPVNDDPSAAQYKDSGVYNNGQQTEGSTMWVPGTGRELAGSFYNLPPVQAVNAFPGLYHPSQPMPATPVHPLLHPQLTLPVTTLEMAGPPANAFQPAQRAQINWTTNY